MRKLLALALLPLLWACQQQAGTEHAEGDKDAHKEGAAEPHAEARNEGADSPTKEARDEAIAYCDILSDWKPAADSLFAPASIPADFVLLADACPDVILEIRYYTTFNFVGRRIPGYERPVAYLTRTAADSLRAVCDELITLGYRLKVFDAYRPQQAVEYFIRWAHDPDDQLMKPYFYPDCPKSELFRRGYLAHKSGHTRGSTVDVTLFDMKTEREADMGSTYDLLGEASHYAWSTGLTPQQTAHRKLLREVMQRHGFRPIACEWWHFTLRNEPYPNIYFNFENR